VRRLPSIEERTLYRAYERVLAERPDAIAQITPEMSYTFTQSHERALRVSGSLRHMGHSPGDPVAWLLGNHADAIHVWMGIGLAGMIEVPVNTALKAGFLAHVLNDSQVQTLIVEAKYVQHILEIAADLQHLKNLVVRADSDSAIQSNNSFVVLPLAAAFEGPPAAPTRVQASDLLAYMYTSGTTGAAKGVMIPHAQAYTHASQEDCAWPNVGDDDRIFCPLPLFHAAGQFYGTYSSVVHQIACLVEPAFSVSRYWSSVRQHNITCGTLMGSMAEMILQQPAQPDDADNPLRNLLLSPFPSDVHGFCRRFGVSATAGYGMTEIGYIATNSEPAALQGPPHTNVGSESGLPRDEFEVKVVDASGNPVPVGEIGELWVRPEHRELITAGYLHQPQLTSEAIVDGWMHTGDAFRLDNDGRLYFIDRMKDTLRRRGENISSSEVEAVFNSHPAVRESAIVGVPWDVGEDEIKATIVLQPGLILSAAELIEFATPRLPAFMVPRYVEFLDELPKTPTQKVIKQNLRARGIDTAWDRLADRVSGGRLR
jgi:carnitine-CoA ligase